MFCVRIIGMGELKTAKQMERHLKGIANHYRIEVLLAIAKHGPMTLDAIISQLDANGKTIGEHTRRLYVAGLIQKKYVGKYAEHSLTPYGKTFVRFLKAFQRIAT